MPDLYARGDYDLAGFCVGVVERKRLIDGRAISPGDVVLGVASSGLHSNGYSLVRKVVFDIAGPDGRRPRRRAGRDRRRRRCSSRRGSTSAPCAACWATTRSRSVVHGIAHITGGGLHENLERILPEGMRAVIDRGSWTVPPVFPWLQRLGEVDADEMDRVFNMGIGLVLVVSPHYADSIRHQLADCGLRKLARSAAPWPATRGVVWG